MFAVEITIISITFLGLLISNGLTLVLTVLFIFKDEPSDCQGADYYIASLAISDLILAIVCVPFSLASNSMSQWTFGTEVCEFCAYLWLTLWLYNIYSFLLLSTDRRLYITDKKYRQYTKRTRRRCICEIILAGMVAFLYSFAPASNRSHLLTKIFHDEICTINWPRAIGYFYTVMITTVVPCLLCSTFNFTKIFYWRMKWKTGRTKTKLTGATVLAIFDPTHVVCLLLYLVFWSSWIPFGIDINRFSGGRRPVNSLNSLYFWLGCSQGIWKFPIMIILCPRYRECIYKFCMVKAANDVRPATTNQNVCNIEISSSPSLQQLAYTVTEDSELHI